jgi:hypothetical protein
MKDKYSKRRHKSSQAQSDTTNYSSGLRMLWPRDFQIWQQCHMTCHPPASDFGTAWQNLPVCHPAQQGGTALPRTLDVSQILGKGAWVSSALSHPCGAAIPNKDGHTVPGNLLVVLAQLRAFSTMPGHLDRDPGMGHGRPRRILPPASNLDTPRCSPLVRLLLRIRVAKFLWRSGSQLFHTRFDAYPI